jgi:hypothetical protein
MKPLNLIFATALSSFVYFGVMKYVSEQPLNALTGFVMINFSLMYLAFMIVIILEAAKIELFKDTSDQE